jgi:hypothetical protein
VSQSHGKKFQNDLGTTVEHHWCLPVVVGHVTGNLLCCEPKPEVSGLCRVMFQHPGHLAQGSNSKSLFGSIGTRPDGAMSAEPS